MPENTIYVGRQRGAPDWGNPFVVGKDGTAEECLEKYRQMWERTPIDSIKAMTSSLRGKDLACWCPLDAPCHADILLEIANN